MKGLGMKGDKGVIDYLNKALRSELTAISQYWLHYRLQVDWGVGRIAETSRKESIEEMHHADKLMDRIIFLEGHPNLQTLDPLRIGENPKETLECDLAAEMDAVALYKEARDYCEKVKDFVSKNLFEELLTDEEGHVDFLEVQLGLMDRIGEENWNQLNAKPTDEVE
jgi:bacterioferritin